jgi:hypothetical protein
MEVLCVFCQVRNEATQAIMYIHFSFQIVQARHQQYCHTKLLNVMIWILHKCCSLTASREKEGKKFGDY